MRHVRAGNCEERATTFREMARLTQRYRNERRSCFGRDGSSHNLTLLASREDNPCKPPPHNFLPASVQQKQNVFDAPTTARVIKALEEASQRWQNTAVGGFIELVWEDKLRR